MRKRLSISRILIVICLVNGLGYVAGFLVSGQPSIYSKSFQLTDGPLTRRVVIPVISHINITADIANVDTLALSVCYAGLRNDNPKLINILLTPGESYVDLDPLSTTGLSPFSFDRLLIEIQPVENTTSLIAGDIVILGRNRTLGEWIQYTFISEGFIIISIIFGFLLLLPYSLLFFQAFYTRHSRDSWTFDLFFRVVSFIFFDLGFFLLLTMFYSEDWHKIPFFPILITTLFTGLFLLGLTIQRLSSPSSLPG